MIRRIIYDASAYVSVLKRNEKNHQWAALTLRSLSMPVLTCEAVVAEACFLMRGIEGGKQYVLNQIKDGIVQIDFSLSAEIDSVRSLMTRYKDVPMSLADACLVRMSELHSGSAIFTLDSDFRIYRKNGRYNIPLITPEGF